MTEQAPSENGSAGRRGWPRAGHPCRTGGDGQEGASRGPADTKTIATALLLTALLSLGEFRLVSRLLYEGSREPDFVLLNVTSILDGHAVWKSSQHRILGPMLVSAMAPFTGGLEASLQWLTCIGVFGANFMLLALLRKRGVGMMSAIIAVAGLDFMRLLTLYKFEYPWDTLDVLLFLLFGYWASRNIQHGGVVRPRELWLALPLVLVGMVNHETVLYWPLWFAVACCERSPSQRDRRRNLWIALALSLACGMAILILREALYRGAPPGPPDWPERATPLIANPTHIAHNLGQFFVEDWRAGRAFISGGLAAALVALGWLLASGRHRRAALWSLGVVASIFCFGYVNETRLYLPLLAFWFAYGWPR